MQTEERTLWNKASSQSLVLRFQKYLQEQGFKRGVTDNNLYFKTNNEDFLIIVAYVDDIIFGSNVDRMNQKFAEEMQKQYEMSMLGEFPFFLGLQISQSNKEIFIS
jgi:hypothetical protein